MNISIVIPTYNENDNLKNLTHKINSALKEKDYQMVIVDDNSPDGTAELAGELSKDYPIKVIKREGKLGLASAILDGFHSSDGEIVGVMDADLQHPPALVKELIEEIEDGYDIAIASRYIPGGGVRDWSFLRRLVSKGATMLAKPLTPVKDPMSGCFFLRKEIINNHGFAPSGYKILLEILVKTESLRIKEVPYIFEKRKAGESKLSTRVYLNYLQLLARLYTRRARRLLKI